MNALKTGILAFVAALTAAVSFADEPARRPSIVLDRVQQRYPWNGLVDIDYTVDLAGGKAEDHFIRFTATTNGVPGEAGFVLREFLSTATLVNASNGSHRVTWDSASDGRAFFASNVTFKAALVFSPGNKRSSPYPGYLVIDVSGGAAAVSYPVKTEFLCTSEAVRRYAADEYKTDRIVVRCVRASQDFMMGSPADEPGRESAGWMNPETRHRVTLTRDFMIGVYPVTQAQWTRVTGKNPSAFQDNGEAPTCPVDSVAGSDVVPARRTASNVTNRLVASASFFGLLRSKTGNAYPFGPPTEAEWECACRAGTRTATPPGTLDRQAWHAGNAQGRTRGVGQKAPNPWGLFDMLGNVWELCQDSCFAAPDSDLGSLPVTDPLVFESNAVTPRRGGSYADGAAALRSACREGSIAPSSRVDTCGVRIGGLLP